MRANATGTPSSDAKESVQRKRRFPRWLMWAGGVMLVILLAVVAIAAYVIHNAEPILRRRVVANLEQRFRAPVELDALHISLLQGLEVSGSGLRIFPTGGTKSVGERPIVSVDNFSFRTDIRGLFEPVMRINTVTVSGMRLNIPPKQNHGSLLRHEKLPQRLKLSIVADKVVCRDMTLTIETNKPGKQPLVFDIHDVMLHDLGPEEPLPFEASLVNPKPRGDIHSTGHFGPWVADDPRQTPVDGSYSFTNADLNTIKGISGILSSTGRYSGTLGEIEVAGTTDTPDFSLDVSDHPVDLRTEFNATVDGTTGDTKLNSVKATLLHTVLQVSGTVMRTSSSNKSAGGANESGHSIDISVTSNQARVEDLLRLGAKNSPPLMQGAMTLHARLSIPPGHISVTQKMRVQGTFAIHGATLSNPQWQDTVDKLSERATGNPREANTADAAHVASSMSSSFVLANAMLDLPKLNYQIPGAQVDLTGKYGLNGETFDFAGTVRTRATASQMLTGWKSILAMPLDPLLKKNGAGLQVPIKISGTKAQPKFGLDLDKLFSRPKQTASQTQPQPARRP